MNSGTFYVLIRGGNRQMFFDPTAGETMPRELVWGPEAFEQWVTTRIPLDEFPEDYEYAAIADFDSKRLTWFCPNDLLSIPKVAGLYQRLLAAAWPGFEIIEAPFTNSIIEELGFDDLLDTDIEAPELDQRPPTVEDAVRDASNWHEDELEDSFGSHEDSEFDDDDFDDKQENRNSSSREMTVHEYGSDTDLLADYVHEDDSLCAWVTLIDRQGIVRHRMLSCLPQNLIQGSPDALIALESMQGTEVPAEANVMEGIWIHVERREVRIWGAPDTQAALPYAERGWSGWDVAWATRGYEQQCSAAGPAGRPLSTEAALGTFMPLMLSTERMSLSGALEAIGGSLKKTAMKATGCLLVVICSPLLIFGAVSGNWTAVLITVAIMVLLTMIGFVTIERKVKRSFAAKMPQGERDDRFSAAGPLDKAERRKRMKALLAEAGLPSLEKVEPYMAPVSEFGLFENA
ncbi:MAG: hypothetical protein U0892_05725 [Pirellulales bacterium]